jgi:hypothetical protein
MLPDVCISKYSSPFAFSFLVADRHNAIDVFCCFIASTLTARHVTQTRRMRSLRMERGWTIRTALPRSALLTYYIENEIILKNEKEMYYL